MQNRRADIRAEVRDDFDIERVWATIYPPSYQPPDESEELVQESLQTILLLDQGNNIYTATHSGFDENGTYRIVIYAQDRDRQQARPVTVEVQVGTSSHALYLPLVIK